MGSAVHPRMRPLLNWPHSGTHHSSPAQRSDISKKKNFLSNPPSAQIAKKTKPRLSVGRCGDLQCLDFLVLNSR